MITRMSPRNQSKFRGSLTKRFELTPRGRLRPYYPVLNNFLSKEVFCIFFCRSASAAGACLQLPAKFESWRPPLASSFGLYARDHLRSKIAESLSCFKERNSSGLQRRFSARDHWRSALNSMIFLQPTVCRGDRTSR